MSLTAINPTSLVCMKYCVSSQNAVGFTIDVLVSCIYIYVHLEGKKIYVKLFKYVLRIYKIQFM